MYELKFISEDYVRVRIVKIQIERNGMEGFLQQADKEGHNTVNEKWMDHIDAMTALKEGIGLRAYAQTNPLQAYKIEAFNMFEELNNTIREESVRAVFSLKPRKKEPQPLRINFMPKITNLQTSGGSNEDTPKRQPVVNKEKKVGRNDPCPCGSGKKYKNCCGKNA